MSGTVLMRIFNKVTGRSEALQGISGAALIYGLARNSVRVSSGTYNTTEIFGYRVLVAGTGTLTLSPVGGATDIVLTSAEVISMGFQPMPEHLDSITLGNADMEVLVYTP
jgi:hypothetical protein